MSSQSISMNTKTQDHIVHLTPPGTVAQATEQFRRLGFNVVPGGTHADGMTANALVVLADGVYLELISFVHPPSYYPPDSPERKQRENHYWARKTPGWIDYAFLGNGSRETRISDIINERAQRDGSGAFYHKEEDGGRKRPDGIVLEWLVSNPVQNKRGLLPFFCGDITPRNRRVPSDPPSNTVHTNTTQGIAHIRVLTDQNSLTSVAKQLISVVGQKPESSTTKRVVWKLDTVNLGKQPPKLILSTPVHDISDEVQFVGEHGTGIYEIGFRVLNGKGPLNATPYGKVVWVQDDTEIY